MPDCNLLSVYVLREACELHSVQTEWERWQHHPNTTWQQYHLALAHLPGVLHPYVIATYRDGELQCLLVGRAEVTRVTFAVGYGQWFKRCVRTLVFMHEGVLGTVSAEAAKLIVPRVLAGLREEHADIAIFNSYRNDSELYDAITTASASPIWGHRRTTRVHRSMSVPSSSDELWGSFSSKVRKNLRRQFRAFGGQYQDRLVVKKYTSSSDLDTVVRDAESVAQTTYQRGLGVGFIGDQLFRARASQQAAAGQFLAFLLYIDDSPCAFWIGSVYEGIFYSSSMGYNAAYSKYSPGMYLIVKSIEYMCDAMQVGEAGRVETIDFGQGDAQYKEVLGDKAWHEESVYLFSNAPRGQMLRAMFELFRMADGIGRWILHRSRSLTLVKQWWRRQLRNGQPPANLG